MFKLLDEGAHICLCALRGMTREIQHTFSRVAKAKEENWEMKLKLHSLRKNSGNVEVSFNLMIDCYGNKSSWLNKRKHELQIITPIMASPLVFFLHNWMNMWLENNGL